MTTPMTPSPPLLNPGAADPPFPPAPPGDWHWPAAEEPEEEGNGPNGRETPVEPRAEPVPPVAFPAPHRIRLVFQSQHGVERGALLRVARWMGLDVWGDSLLNRRAAREMGSAAMLLAVVLAFELLAWSMLFNVLVHSAQWKLSPLSLMALLLGGIFAAAVFLFEKSFVTADASEERWRIAIAYAIRLVVIIGSALATAQPIELLVFGGAIENRLYEENVLAEAVRQIGSLDDRQTKAQGKSEKQIQAEISGSGEHQAVQETEKLYNATYQEVLELEDDRTEAQQAVARAADREGYWRDLLLKAQRERRPNDPASAARESRAARNLDFVRRQKATAQANLTRIQDKLNSANIRLKTLQEKLNLQSGKLDELVEGKRQENEKEAQRNQVLAEGIREWMQFVQNARPGELDPRTKRSLPPRPADFTERLIVLDDLRNARPALWPATTPEKRTRAVEEFGLSDPSQDTAALKRMEQKAGIFQAVYRVAFIMALVIPLLTVAFKILMAGELRAYYSTLAQARAGNPAAIEVVLARGQQVWGDGGPGWRG